MVQAWIIKYGVHVISYLLTGILALVMILATVTGGQP